jgi:hypothetical protein
VLDANTLRWYLVTAAAAAAAEGKVRRRFVANALGVVVVVDVVVVVVVFASPWSPPQLVLSDAVGGVINMTTSPPEHIEPLSSKSKSNSELSATYSRSSTGTLNFASFCFSFVSNARECDEHAMRQAHNNAQADKRAGEKVRARPGEIENNVELENCCRGNADTPADEDELHRISEPGQEAGA